MNPFEFYLALFLKERPWSLVSVAYLFLTLTVRLAIFRGLISESKHIDHRLYSEVVKGYHKNSLPGWMLFLASWLLLITVWLRWDGTMNDRIFLCALGVGVPLIFLSSIILHLRAFSMSLLSLLRQRIGVEREF